VSQLTSLDFTGILKKSGIKISMDGEGRATDNAFIERLWRSVKVEHVHIKPAEGGIELYKGLAEYFDFYNNQRPHQSLNYQAPVVRFEAIKSAA
jgi:putative transposase